MTRLVLAGRVRLKLPVYGIALAVHFVQVCRHDGAFARGDLDAELARRKRAQPGSGVWVRGGVVAAALPIAGESGAGHVLQKSSAVIATA